MSSLLHNPTKEQLDEAERLGPLYRFEYTTTCAATVMFQTRLGRRNKMIMDTREKFLKNPGTLGAEAYFPRREVVKWMDPATNGVGGNGGPWFLTMYVYEIVKGSSKRERDWGHLVFADVFVNRCLLVMVFPPPSDDRPGFSREDYATLTKWHANRFMAMCMCIFHGDMPVEWVRGTYVTEDQIERKDFRLDSSFLHFDEDPPTTSSAGRNFPPFFTVTPETVEPCLLPSDIHKIDSIRAQDPKSMPCPVPESVRSLVMGSRDTRVHLGDSEWQNKHYRACSQCNASKKLKDLRLCARCNVEYYCGKECQKLAWKEHKRWCRVAF